MEGLSEIAKEETEEKTQTSDKAVSEEKTSYEPPEANEYKPFFSGQEKRTDSDYAARSIADVFGVSETELEDEFNAYKVEKLLSRVDELIDFDAAKGKLSYAATCMRRYGFGSLTVFPNRVNDCEKLLKGGGINALVNYPCGGEDVKTLLYAVKMLKKTKAKRVFIVISEALLESNRTAELKKLLKNAKKTSRRFVVTPTVKLDVNQTQIMALIKACLEVGICSIGLRDSVFSERSKLTVKSLVALCTDKIEIIALGEIDAKNAIRLFKSGVSVIASSIAVELAEELEREIKREKK